MTTPDMMPERIVGITTPKIVRIVEAPSVRAASASVATSTKSRAAESARYV